MSLRSQSRRFAALPRRAVVAVSSRRNSSIAQAELLNVTLSLWNQASGDAICMRRVYHHLGDPSSVLTSIYEALRPGGRLAIIEFRAGGLIGMVTGMGIDQAPLVDAVTASGFKVVTAEDWPGWDHYVVVFEKQSETR